MRLNFSSRWIVLAGGLVSLSLSMVACSRVDPPSGIERANAVAKALDGNPIAPGPGGVFTDGCEAACNGAGVICGAVQDPTNGAVCCCIGGCPGWGPACAQGVGNGTILPGFSPVGPGVFTADCEASCNGAGVTCGTVAGANGQTCCCIGTCPELANACAEGVVSGAIGPGAVPGPGGFFTQSCEAACNGAGVICGTVANAAGQTCCCIGGCPGWGPACAQGVGNGTILPGFSPVGQGVFTADCEASCNGAGVTCGTVAGANGQTCCCIGTCPELANACADGVASGAIGPGAVPGPGGFFTQSCEAACNGAGVICGTVANAAGQTCCCIGGCPGWGPACAQGVGNGTILPGFSPVGQGVFTADCEASCNGAGVTCGTVAGANGQTCCCIGTCPELANSCAEGVASGAIGPGAVPGPGGFFTQSCEAACNGAGVNCGTVANAAGQTCCCIGGCPELADICLAGVAKGQILPGARF
jgi:hypothetical protein